MEWAWIWVYELEHRREEHSVRVGVGMRYGVICTFALDLQHASLVRGMCGESPFRTKKSLLNLCNNNLLHVMPSDAPQGVLPYAIYLSTMQYHRPMCLLNPNAFLSCPSCPANAHSVLFRVPSRSRKFDPKL